MSSYLLTFYFPKMKMTGPMSEYDKISAVLFLFWVTEGPLKCARGGSPTAKGEREGHRWGGEIRGKKDEKTFF